MISLKKVKGFFQNIWKFIKNIPEMLKELFAETKTEVFILAIIGGLIAGFISFRHERAREAHIPLAFSEIHSIIYACESKKVPVPALTMFYAGTNDMVMKVFERSNTAYSRTLFGSVRHTFASELDMATDPSFKVHYFEIPQLVGLLPEVSDKILNYSLNEFVGAQREISVLNQHLDAAWDDNHNDVYHTEIYFTTETHTDSEGHSHTETVMHTRQVYDYTIHTYTYYPKEGEVSSKLLDAFASAHPSLEPKEKLFMPSQTGAENEYAMGKSRENDLKKSLTPKEMVSLARNWATGSTLAVNLPGITSMISMLNHDAPAWRSGKLTAHNDSYKTYSHSDAGPLEFQIAQNALEHGRNLEKLIGDTIQGILVVKTKTPELLSEIRAFVDIEMNHKEGNANAHRGKIISIAREIYDKNFKGGFSIRPARYWFIPIWILVGIIAGGALGLGVDYLGDRMGWWNGGRERSDKYYSRF